MTAVLAFNLLGENLYGHESDLRAAANRKTFCGVSAVDANLQKST
jgi:hypothetical protein